MPVLTVICHLALVNTNMFPTRIAVFGIEGLKAGAAVGASLLHDVTLASQHCLTLKTAKVLHVPVTALRLCALIRKDDLVTRSAAGLQSLCVMPPTVDFSILVEVDKVYQKLIAHAAHKASRVPTHAVTCPGGKDSYVSTVYLPSALLTDRPGHCHRERSHVATAKVFTFTLVTEELQLPLLLIVQSVAVAYLIVMGW